MVDREPPRKEMNDDRRKVSTSKREKGAQQDKRFRKKRAASAQKGAGWPHRGLYEPKFE